MVVFDSNDPKNSHVVMSFDEYERIMSEKVNSDNLTEQELIDKINGDIAMWKSKNGDFGDNLEEEVQTEENLYYYPEKEGEEDKKRGWTISEDMKKKAEEIN